MFNQLPIAQGIQGPTIANAMATQGPTVANANLMNAQNPGMFSNMMTYAKENPNQMALIMDQMGQKINPTASNVTGGIGSALAKSSMAGQKLEEDKKSSEAFFHNLLKNLQSGSGMNKVTITKDPETGAYKTISQDDIQNATENIPTQPSVSGTPEGDGEKKDMSNFLTDFGI